jgi:hypothetical protein
MTDDFFEWLTFGISKGWITEPFCGTHDEDPGMTDEEREAWETGGDPCWPAIRITEASAQ